MCIEENQILAGTSLETCTGGLLRGQIREVRKSENTSNVFTLSVY